MSTEPNAAAFPHEVNLVHAGLTKREYFAALAMQGMGTWMPFQGANLTENYTLSVRAEWAVRQADALIAALNEK